MNYIFYFSALSFLLSLTSCGQGDCNIPGGYMFERPATLSPAQSIYKVGDTITVSSTFSDEVYDRATERNFLLENFSFFPLTVFCRLDTLGIDTLEIVTAEHFDFVISPTYNYSVLISYSFGAALEGEFNYENNVYDLEYKIVVKKPGLYLMQFGSSLDQFGDRQDFPGKCSGEKVDSWTVLNNGEGNNAEFLLEAVSEGWHRVYTGKLDNNFHRLGGYCFKVE